MKGVNKGKISERRGEAAALIVFAKLSPSERDLWANRSLCVVKPQWEFVFSPAYPCVLPRVKLTFHPPVVQQFQQRHRRSIVMVTALLCAPCEVPEELGAGCSTQSLSSLVSPSGLDSIGCPVLILYRSLRPLWSSLLDLSQFHGHFQYLEDTSSEDGTTLSDLPFHLVPQKLRGAVSSPVCLFWSLSHFFCYTLQRYVCQGGGEDLL